MVDLRVALSRWQVDPVPCYPAREFGGRKGRARTDKYKCTTDKGDCKFPFKYNGVSYDKCTEKASKGKPWCANTRARAHAHPC